MSTAGERRVLPTTEHRAGTPRPTSEHYAGTPTAAARRPQPAQRTCCRPALRNNDQAVPRVRACARPEPRAAAVRFSRVDIPCVGCRRRRVGRNNRCAPRSCLRESAHGRRASTAIWAICAPHLTAGCALALCVCVCVCVCALCAACPPPCAGRRRPHARTRRYLMVMNLSAPPHPIPLPSLQESVWL